MAAFVFLGVMVCGGLITFWTPIYMRICIYIYAYIIYTYIHTHMYIYNLYMLSLRLPPSSFWE